MATADVKTFWSAFVSVLLKCIAALGFATPARTKTPAAVTGTASPAGTAASVTSPVATASVTRAAATDRSEPDTDRPGRRADGRTTAIPSPRCSYAYPPRRTRRGRMLPPTMKQRIHAEAHGTSPSARKALATDAFDTLGTPDDPGFAGSAMIPAPRPRVHGARCE